MYEAGLKIENRFLLATTAIQATRKLHVSSTRTEDTVNRVLAEVAKGQNAHGDLPKIAPPPDIDLLLITPSPNLGPRWRTSASRGCQSPDTELRSFQ